MHAYELLHAHNEKFYRGINYFRGGPNIMGIQIFRYTPHKRVGYNRLPKEYGYPRNSLEIMVIASPMNQSHHFTAS